MAGQGRASADRESDQGTAKARELALLALERMLELTGPARH